MRLHSKFAMMALVFVPVVVFLAYNSLSASNPERDPFAAFAACDQDASADFIPAPVAPEPKKAWTVAVQNVLDQVEQLESRLELYSAQLEAIENRRVGEEVANLLELDPGNPGKALEEILGRFSGMVDAYAALDEDSKGEIAVMSESDRIDALSRAASVEAEINAGIDRLASIRSEKALQERAVELAAFEASLTVIVAGRSAIEAAAAEGYLYQIAAAAEQSGRAAIEKATEAFMIGKVVQMSGKTAADAAGSTPGNTPPAPLK